MITTRDPARRDRKRRILEEAAQILAERGYYGFGVEELASRCGLTKPGLLYHFGSKENLLIEVLRDRDRCNEIEVTRECLDLSSPEALRAIMRIGARQPQLVRLSAILRVESLNKEHPAHEYFNRRDAAALELLSKMFADCPEQARSMARQVYSMILGLELQWIREEFSFDLVEEWDRQMARLSMS